MRLSGLYRYPLKSSVAEPLTVSAIGALGLEGDRRWLVVDETNGRFMTQRQFPRMTQLTARYTNNGLNLSAPGYGAIDVPQPAEDAPERGVTVWTDTLRVPDAGEEAAAWLSAFFERPCRLVYMPEDCIRLVNGAEPGDRVSFADGFPVLLIGEGSLADLSQRVGRSLEMLRFRPNLVISGIEPYAEDRWKRVRIGELEFRIAKPCTRCVMTTLEPATGEKSGDLEPLKTLATYRKGEGGVLFGQNLVCDGIGRLEVGMAVEVLE
jgi:uncharacterized protein